MIENVATFADNLVMKSKNLISSLEKSISSLSLGDEKNSKGVLARIKKFSNRSDHNIIINNEKFIVDLINDIYDEARDSTYKTLNQHIDIFSNVRSKLIIVTKSNSIIANILETKEKDGEPKTKDKFAILYILFIYYNLSSVSDNYNSCLKNFCEQISTRHNSDTSSQSIFARIDSMFTKNHNFYNALRDYLLHVRNEFIKISNEIEPEIINKGADDCIDMFENILKKVPETHKQIIFTVAKVLSPIFARELDDRNREVHSFADSMILLSKCSNRESNYFPN